jgi:hypothetical protein
VHVEVSRIPSMGALSIHCHDGSIIKTDSRNKHVLEIIENMNHSVLQG